MIFVAGYPKDIGGANTELWHTLKLWRGYGLDVTLIPTWGPKIATPETNKRLAGIGVKVVETTPDNLIDIDGLPNSIVVAFCNERFIEHAHAFQGLGCRLVWAGCMNFQFAVERLHNRKYDPMDRYVFQSEHQRDQITPHIAKLGVTDDQCPVIHGAFDPGEFPHNPLKHDGDRFIVGRLSRPDAGKFAPDYWRQIAAIPYPTSVHVMGWSQAIEDKVGIPPEWAACSLPCSESPQSFYAGLHALVPGIGAIAENWPRIGLEAMSAGVPIVAERRGGWPEMLGDDGVLVDDRDHLAYSAAKLAYDPQYRMGVIVDQFARLTEITDPQRIWSQWETLFSGLS